jgi:Dipeptidyl aminopeptidases/acylaminoacyl-peptidases
MKYLLGAVIWRCTFTIYAKLPELIPREPLFGALSRRRFARRSLLDGDDPRVAIVTSDAIVAALRKAKHEVAYVTYSEEGHGFARPENQLDFYGRVEEFLAGHLGGRAER